MIYVTEVAPGTQWLAVNLPPSKKGYTVVGVTTQGRPISSGYAQWITSFNLQFSDDGNTWTDITENGQIKVSSQAWCVPYSDNSFFKMPFIY